MGVRGLGLCGAREGELEAGDRAAPPGVGENCGEVERGVLPELALGRSEGREGVGEARHHDDGGVVEGGAGGAAGEGDDVLAQGTVSGERDIASVRKEGRVGDARAEDVADDAELDGVVVTVGKRNGCSDLLYVTSR